MADATAQLWVEIGAKIGKLQEGLNTATAAIQGTEKKINAATSNISKTITAAFSIAGVFAVQKLITSLSEMADAGEAAGSVQESFQKLGGSSSQIDKAKKSVLGMVDSFTLMKTANEGLLAQVPGFNENFSKIAELGGRVANTLQLGTAEGIDRVTKALIEGSPATLKSIGLTVNADKAYQDFAKSNNLVATTLTKQQKTLAVQIAAIGQLDSALSRLAPITDSAANAHQAFNAALTEAQKKIDIAVNNNEAFTQGWRDLQKVIEKIDWTQIGQSIATVAGIILKLSSDILPLLVEEIEGAARGFNYLLGDDTQAKADRLAVKISTIQSRIENLKNLNGKSFGGGDIIDTTAQVSELEKQLEDLKNQFRPLRDELGKTKDTATKGFDEITKSVKDLNNGLNQPSSKQIEKDAEAAKKAAEKFQMMKESWDKTVTEIEDNSLKKSIDSAVSKLDTDTFYKLKAELEKNIEDAFVEANRKAIEAGVVTEDVVRAEGRKKAEIEGQEVQKSLTDAYKTSVDAWQTFFENAITGTTFKLSDVLKQVAVGFAAQIAQGVFGSLGSITSPQGLGQALARNILGNISSGSGGGLGSLLGGLNIFGSGRPDGVAGPLMQNGQFTPGILSTNGIFQGAGSLSAYVTAGMAAFNAISHLGQSTEATVKGLSEAAGAGFGAAFGGPIGALVGDKLGAALGRGLTHIFGLGGPTNKETLDRMSFAKSIESALSKLTSVIFFNSQGKLTSTPGSEFNFSSTGGLDFNSPNWADSFHKLSQNTQKTFGGLGEALKQLYGLTQDIGPQIGAILAANFGGNIDNARLLVQQLGLSFSQLQDVLVKAGESGALSWHEVESALQGVANATKKGLAAFGDVKGAWDEIINSGGRGLAAIKGLRDIGLETLEKGGQTLEDIRKTLIKKGVDPAEIDTFMKALKIRGITSLEQLANVSSRVGGGIIADMQSGSKLLADTWADMAKQLEDVTNKLNDIPKEVASNVNLTVTSHIDDQTRGVIAAINSGSGRISLPNPSRHALGDVISMPTMFNGGRDLAGESGVEGILPLTRINGKLGVMASGMSSSMIINIDARGSSPGVESRIMSVMRDLEESAVRRAVQTVANLSQRGGRYSETFK